MCRWGVIFTGILAGPHLLGLVKAMHELEILAKIGVILLLFTISVEFSFANLLQIRQSVLVAGPLQVAATCRWQCRGRGGDEGTGI